MRPMLQPLVRPPMSSQSLPTLTPWPWPPLLRLSLAVHAVALIGVVFAPRHWPWALGLVALNHAVITACGLWPRSQCLGLNITRLPADASASQEWALTIDDGPDPAVTPTVLDLLDAYGAKATFFCIAERAQAHPDLVRAILARGHSIQNHSHRHRHTFALNGPRGFAQEIHRAQATLGALTGQRPRFFRAPAGLRNPFLDPVLHRLGLTLVSWTRRGYDTRESRADVVLERLTDGLRAGDILLLHDGHAARGPQGRPVILDVLPGLLSRARSMGLHAVTLDQALPARAGATGF